MREPGAVIDIPGLHLPQRITHIVPPAHIDAHPLRSVGQVWWWLTPGPGDHLLDALQMLDQIAASEAGGAGDQGDGGHGNTADSIPAKGSEEIRERADAGQHEGEVKTRVGTERKPQFGRIVVPLELGLD